MSSELSNKVDELEERERYLMVCGAVHSFCLIIIALTLTVIVVFK